MTDDPWAEDKCEHGCWEPKVWSSIVDSAVQEIKNTEKEIISVSQNRSASIHAENYHTFLTGKIEGLRVLMDFVEGARMGITHETVRRRYV